MLKEAFLGQILLFQCSGSCVTRWWSVAGLARHFALPAGFQRLSLGGRWCRCLWLSFVLYRSLFVVVLLVAVVVVMVALCGTCCPCHFSSPWPCLSAALSFSGAAHSGTAVQGRFYGEIIVVLSFKLPFSWWFFTVNCLLLLWLLLSLSSLLWLLVVVSCLRCMPDPIYEGRRRRQP